MRCNYKAKELVGAAQNKEMQPRENSPKPKWRKPKNENKSLSKKALLWQESKPKHAGGGRKASWCLFSVNNFLFYCVCSAELAHGVCVVMSLRGAQVSETDWGPNISHSGTVLLIGPPKRADLKAPWWLSGLCFLRDGVRFKWCGYFGRHCRHLLSFLSRTVTWHSSRVYALNALASKIKYWHLEEKQCYRTC